jgi:hypothetical protein
MPRHGTGDAPQTMNDQFRPSMGKQLREGNPSRSSLNIPTNLLLLDGVADDIAEHPIHLVFWLSCCIHSGKKCEGGILLNASTRTDDSWLRIGVIGAECRRDASPLWHWSGSTLVMDYYDHHGEATYLKQMNGAIQSREKKAAQKEARPQKESGPLKNHEEQSSRHGTNGVNHDSALPSTRDIKF